MSTASTLEAPADRAPVCKGDSADRANWRRAVVLELARTREPLSFVAAFAVDVFAMTPGGMTAKPEHPRVRALLNANIEQLTGHSFTPEDVRGALLELERRGMLPPWCHPLRTATPETDGGVR